MSKRKANDPVEMEVLQLKLKIAEQQEEIRKLTKAGDMWQHALREQSILFKKLKPSRAPLTAERKLYIAGSQHFRCAAPHGRDKCPNWLLFEGSFNEAGFEIDHIKPYSEGYRHSGELSALCFTCHGLKSRLERMALAEKVDEDEDE